MGRVELPESPRELLEDECPPDGILAAIREHGASLVMEDVGSVLEWADVGIELARRYGAIRLARMLAYRGSVFRMAGHYEESESHFNEAFSVLSDQSPADKADILRRMAWLRADQYRLDEASDLADRAIDLSKRYGSKHQLGKALASAATVWYAKDEYDEAAHYFADSQQHLDYKASPSSYYAVSHNLAAALVKAPNVKRFGSVFAALKAARRNLPREPRQLEPSLNGLKDCSTCD